MSSCCQVADWKREEIAEHKFDYIDVEDFLDKSILSRMRYTWVFLLTLKSILLYMADIGILIIMITAANELYQILAGDPNAPCDVQRYGPAICSQSFDTLKKIGSVSTLIPIPARLGIVFASMFFSFLFLFIEWRKGRKIVKSRDISYALTSAVAYRYYSIQSFAHFCFFQKIQNSRRTVDILAFYVYFTFKNWKRLMLAELPRQLIYGLFVFDIIRAQMISMSDNDYDSQFIKFFAAIRKYYDLQRPRNLDLLAQYALMTFTVTIWIISFLNLIVAFLIYIPILTKIRGNLKEYCCHKIDKRIDEILRKKSRKRMAAARAAEIQEIEKNAARGGAKFRPWADDSSSFTTASTHATATSYNQRMAPPLGMTVGPTLPHVDSRDLSGPIVYHDYTSQYQYYQQAPLQQRPPLLYENALADTSSDCGSRIGSPAPSSIVYSRAGGNGGATYQQIRGSPSPTGQRRYYQERPPSN